jgi:hypothetical protein
MTKVFTFSLESNLNIDKNRSTLSVGGFWEIYAPTGIRTPVVALKGLRPSPLDDGGGLASLTHVSALMCGGTKPPTSKRADFIIPSSNGQAFYLLLLFCTLVEESQDIHLFAIDQNPRAFGFDIGDKNCRKSRFIHGDEVSGFISDD